MEKNELSYIDWYEESYWVANIVLGGKNIYYQFSTNWNNRSEAWHVTIKHDDEVIIQGVKLVLNVDLLTLASVKTTPDCILIPFSENKQIERIDFENMINGEVKLYHILTGK